MNQNPPSFLPPPPPPPPAATASKSPATIWTGTTTLSYLDWNYYSPMHIWTGTFGILELWNSGTAAAVAAMFFSLQLGAFEHQGAFEVNKLQQEDTSPASL
jgi:hypothetical protein